MTPAARYAELELVMLNNLVPDAEIDPVVDEMDDCWRRMSDEERQDADDRAKAWAVKTKHATP